MIPPVPNNDGFPVRFGASPQKSTMRPAVPKRAVPGMLFAIARLMVASSVHAEDDFAFFERHVRPVFVKHCHECHSAESAELRSGLRVDDRVSLLAGGDGGRVIVAGRPEESRLLDVLTTADSDVRMPPDSHGGPLPQAIIDRIADWIRDGAAMPNGPPLERDAFASIHTHWAFQPIARSAPPETDSTWSWGLIDRFLAARLESRGLAPVADAQPAVLLRRLYLDLIGLPPEPEEVRAFLDDPSRGRFGETVDRLLASPRYGERWGRHWLDVARYAESSGKETDFAYPYAWRYRDYVIDAFNDDMPFNQFVMEQVAGDCFEFRNDRERAELLVATGFLAIGPKSHVERNPMQFEMDLVDEQIDTVSQAFLGLSIACARCHDHKYDPVTQRDYYALAGIFRSTDTRFGTIRMLQNLNPSDLVELPRSAGQPDGLRRMAPRERSLLEEQVARLREDLDFARRAPGGPALNRVVQSSLRLATLSARLDAHAADGTPRHFAMCVLDDVRPTDSALFRRGEVEDPGAIVPRGLPSLASLIPASSDDEDGTRSFRSRPTGSVGRGESGRLDLARWIASSDNPLTPRVIVNRVWLHLFGSGLVTTPDNFGLAGEHPTHPDLLDHLAAEFVADGWSIKRLIRRLVMTHAYALSTVHDESCRETDPANTLRWRMTPRRLDAEVIRDAILATAGSLDLEPPEGSTVVDFGEGLSAAIFRGQGQPLDEGVFKRAVYLPVIRGTPLDSLALFDMTAGTTVTGERSQTVVPAQSLYLLNSPFVLAQSDAAAGRVYASAGDDRGRVAFATLAVLGRTASSDEIAAAVRFVQSSGGERLGWPAFCQALWASHELLCRN
ncbi:MAG: PSD1 and planctomycete cytochrome C domain-containing protein [Planctomycetaceae bacterium]